MKVKLHTDLPSKLRGRINCYLSSNPDKAWWDILAAVSGKTMEVSTTYLFQDQFNVEPMPGVTDCMIGVMAWMVEEVIDDVRPDYFRCQWCGKPSHHSSVYDDTCPRCQTRGYMERFTKDIKLARTKMGTSYILAVP